MHASDCLYKVFEVVKYAKNSKYPAGGMRMQSELFWQSWNFVFPLPTSRHDVYIEFTATLSANSEHQLDNDNKIDIYVFFIMINEPKSWKISHTFYNWTVV
jgi:hypothetical protein